MFIKTSRKLEDVKIPRQMRTVIDWLLINDCMCNISSTKSVNTAVVFLWSDKRVSSEAGSNLQTFCSPESPPELKMRKPLMSSDMLTKMFPDFPVVGKRRVVRRVSEGFALMTCLVRTHPAGGCSDTLLHVREEAAENGDSAS